MTIRSQLKSRELLLIRDQFDNYADTTIINSLFYLHDYKAYNCKFKCPGKLTDDIDSSDVYPLGEGNLNIPATVPSEHFVTCCFYSPHISSTLVSHSDVLKTAKNWNKDFSNQDMRSFFFKDGNPNFEHYTLTCHRCLSTQLNIFVNGDIMAANYYTHPLIAHNLPLNHPSVNLLKYVEAK